MTVVNKMSTDNGLSLFTDTIMSLASDNGLSVLKIGPAGGNGTRGVGGDLMPWCLPAGLAFTNAERP